MRLRWHITLALLLVTLSPQLSEARIRLAMLPVRERVELQLDHGGYTLVEEERIVPLLKSSAKTGNNSIDFSWSNTAIDKDSMYDRVPVSKTFTFDWYRNGQLNPEKPLASPTQMHYELTTDAISVDFRTVETRLKVAARGKTELPHTVTSHHGTNAKQNRVHVLAP